MSPMMYLLRRSLANTVKGIFKKPLILIGYLFVALFIIAMVAASFFMPSGSLNHGSPSMFRAVTTGVFAVIIYFSLRLGIDKGSTYFRMSDVNFLFPAPFRPNQVLIYGFIRQIGGTLFLMMIALFQIPNLKNNFIMKPYGPFIIMIAVLMFMFAYPVFAMLMYSWSSKSAGRRKLGKALIDGAAILVVAGFLWKLAQTRALVPALTGLLDRDAVNWIPFIGWIKMVLSAAVDGITPAFWLGIGLTAAFVSGFTVWIYRMNLDYYEDVLEATEYAEAVADGFISMFSILAFSVYMLFFFSIQGRWSLELGKPFIFLIPVSTAEKLFFATLTEHIKNLLDGTLLFLLAGVLFKANAAMIAGCIFSYMMFGAVFLYGDVLARRLFGGVHAKGLMIFLKLVFILLILVPGIGAVVAVGILTESTILMILAFGGWGCIAAVTMFMLSLGVFDNLESAG